MARATWNGVVLAQSDDTVIVEGKHYFSRDSLDERYFEQSEHTTECSWKGTASYFHVCVGDKQKNDAAGTIPSPSWRRRTFRAAWRSGAASSWSLEPTAVSMPRGCWP
jgi:uncharacterized protein (DUF427 family)